MTITPAAAPPRSSHRSARWRLAGAAAAQYAGARGFTWASVALFLLIVVASLLRTSGHEAFSSIDEDAHFDYAYVVSQGVLPPTGAQPTTAVTREIFVCRGGLGNTWPVLITCAEDHDSAGFPFGGRSRAMGNPPTWYLLAGGAIALTSRAGVDPLAAARVTGILVFALGAVVLLWAMRAFGIPLLSALGTVLLIVAIPNGFYLGGFAMPHSAYLLVGSGTLLLAHAVTQRPGWPTAAAFVCGCVLALLVLPHMVAGVTIACAYLAVAAVPTRRWPTIVMWPALAGIALLSGLAAWSGISRARVWLAGGPESATGAGQAAGTLISVAAPNPYAVAPATLLDQAMEFLLIGPGGAVMLAHRSWNATNTLDLWWNPVTALAAALAGAGVLWALLGRTVPGRQRLLAVATLIGLAVAVIGINRAFWMTLEELPLRYYAAATPALAILLAGLARRPAAAWALTGLGGASFIAVYTAGPLW